MFPPSNSRVPTSAYHARGLVGALGERTRARSEVCEYRWGLGGSLRLWGSACPVEGDSLDPEGSDLLAAWLHQASA